MENPVFIVPGHGNSGAAHWQSIWQSTRPEWRRLQVDDWDLAVCDEWVSALDRQAGAMGSDLVVVAHSLGCLAVAHWAVRCSPRIRGALLVAVPDPRAAAYPAETSLGFEPLPSARLPFPSIVVASSDDPYGSAAYARERANAWGSEFVEVGARGHINGASGLGDWPEGYRLLQRLL